MVSAIPALYDPRAMVRGRSTYNQEEPDPGTFGYCVFHRRWHQLGLTQQELAARVVEMGGRMKQGDISDLELGKVTEPRRPRMRLLAQALDVSLETLYAWRDDPGDGAQVREESPPYDDVRHELAQQTHDFTPREWARLTELAKRIRETRLAEPARRPDLKPKSKPR